MRRQRTRTPLVYDSEEELRAELEREQVAIEERLLDQRPL
jgi:hypothetical protein